MALSWAFLVRSGNSEKIGSRPCSAEAPGSSFLPSEFSTSKVPEITTPWGSKNFLDDWTLTNRYKSPEVCMQTGHEVTMQPLCLLVEVGGGRNPLLSAIFDHWAGFLLAASVDVAPGLGDIGGEA